MKPCINISLSLHFPKFQFSCNSFNNLLNIKTALIISLQNYHQIPQMGNESQADQTVREGGGECRCSNGVCEFVSKKRVSDDIIPHILNLYGSTASSKDFEIYASDASFEDPLMCAQGVRQIKSAFYSLPKVFSDSRIVEYSIKEKFTSPGNCEILMDNKQYYKFWGRNIDVISLIKLSVKDGKVIRHEDWWDKKPLLNRETVRVPLLGRLIEVTRRGSMLATHALMGFGRDPTE